MFVQQMYVNFQNLFSRKLPTYGIICSTRFVCFCIVQMIITRYAELSYSTLSLCYSSLKALAKLFSVKLNESRRYNFVERP